MGLAPYGEPRYTDALRQLIRLEPDGAFRLDLGYFRHHTEGVRMTWDDCEPTVDTVYTPRLEALLGPARRADEALEPRHEAIAASLVAPVKMSAEEIAARIIAFAEQTTPTPGGTKLSIGEIEMTLRDLATEMGVPPEVNDEAARVGGHLGIFRAGPAASGASRGGAQSPHTRTGQH